jgi:hypothetical protein
MEHKLKEGEQMVFLCPDHKKNLINKTPCQKCPSEEKNLDSAIEEAKQHVIYMQREALNTQYEHSDLLRGIDGGLKEVATHLKKLTGTVSSTNMIFASVPIACLASGMRYFERISEGFYWGVLLICLSPWYGRFVESVLRGWRGSHNGDNAKLGLTLGLILGNVLGWYNIIEAYL